MQDTAEEVKTNSEVTSSMDPFTRTYQCWTKKNLPTTALYEHII